MLFAVFIRKLSFTCVGRKINPTEMLSAVEKNNVK